MNCNESEDKYFPKNNILVTSISKKVPLIKAVKKAAKKFKKDCVIFGGDSNANIVGKYFVDYFWLMPRIDELKTETLIDYCNQNYIAYIIPTRDGELPFFAQNASVLKENGISVMISPYNVVQFCLDKYKFFEVLNSLNYPVIRTVYDIEQLFCDSYVVKERYGAGSRNIILNCSRQELIKHAATLDKAIFQPYVNGDEISVDLYVGKDGICKGVIARTRELVVDGESQITRTIHNEKLENMCAEIAEKMGIYGHAVFQVLLDEQDIFHIIECNNRFGGASSLSLEAGLDSFYWFLMESYGHSISSELFVSSPEGITQVRYAEDLII